MSFQNSLVPADIESLDNRIFDQIMAMPDYSIKEPPKAPNLCDNMALILGCDTNRDVAKALGKSLPAIMHYRQNQSVPLITCLPFLAFMSYETLAYGTIEGTIHARRGYTRDPAAAAPSPDSPGPIYIGLRQDFDGLLERVALVLATRGTERPIAHRDLDVSPIDAVVSHKERQKTRQWLLRRKMPDKICHGFVQEYRVSLAWLLTGFGTPMENAANLPLKPRRIGTRLPEPGCQIPEMSC